MSSHTMDLKEAADTLKVHPHTLEKMIRDGEIPAGKVSGRTYVLMTRDVLAYAERVILDQTADRLKRLGITKVPRKGRRRAGSRSASASAGSCGL